MDPVPPELRENNGEVAAAAAGELPNLVETKDLRGDLHTHTDWSDGGFSIAEMIEAAAERGYDAHAVTDHARRPGDLRQHGARRGRDRGAGGCGRRRAIDAVDGAVWAGEGGAGESGAGEPTDADIEVFHGIEANIDAEGEITTDDDTLADLDIVVASPHSALGQGPRRRHGAADPGGRTPVCRYPRPPDRPDHQQPPGHRARRGGRGRSRRPRPPAPRSR